MGDIICLYVEGNTDDLMNRKYTEQQYKKAMSLHRKGLTFYRISKMTGINKGTIRDWCKRGKKPMSVWTERELQNWADKRITPERNTKISQAMRGEKNPMWKGNEATPMSARGRARRRHIAPLGTEIHHIDGNPFNNEEENIAFATRREHMIDDGRLEKLKGYNDEWAEEEIILIRQMYPDFEGLTQKLNRTRSSIKNKARRMELQNKQNLKRLRDGKGRFQ